MAVTPESWFIRFVDLDTLEITHEVQSMAGCGFGSGRFLYEKALVPSNLSFSPQPSTAVADQTMSPVTVRIENQNGILVVAADIEITISLTEPGDATLSGATTVAAVGGVATFDNLSIDMLGSYSFTASAEELPQIESDGFQVLPAAPDNFEVTVGADAVSTWNEVGDADGYNVYVRPAGGTFSKHNTQLITEEDYTIDDLEPGQFEAYVTTVVGSLESGPSNIQSFQFQVSHPYHSMNFTGDEAVDLTTLGDFASDIRNFTFEIWVKTSSSDIMFIASNDNSASPSVLLALNMDLSFSPDEGKIFFYIFNDFQEGRFYATTADSGIVDGQWHKIDVRVATGEARIWVNGGEVSLDSTGGIASDETSDFANPLLLGQAVFDGMISDFAPFSGKLAFPVVWDIPRSPAVIEGNWNKLPDFEDSDIRAAWVFEEGEGSEASDQSGNDHDATLIPDTSSLESMWDEDIPPIET